MTYEQSGDGHNTTSGEIQQNNVAIHVVAPIVAMTATWAVRKMLDSGYRKALGRKAPVADDPTVNLGNALIWSAITAASAAVVEVAVYRIISRRA
jgi:hypothetical protein